MSGSYFEGSFPELAARLDGHFDRMRAAWSSVAGKGAALVLGGGYGRGEGGVLEKPAGPELFNDLDYFLFTDTPDDPALVSWSHAREKEETAALGVDVEIKRLPAHQVGQGMQTMMFADLVAGHVAVAGDCQFLADLVPSLDFSKVAVEEATRLLWNRGSGLFFSRGKLVSDLTFVVRNHAKLKLALGDALLCLGGHYSPRCRERGMRFAGIELSTELEKLHAWHAQAVDFKFRPIVPALDRATLEEESRQLAAAWLKVFLHVEARRLGIHKLTLTRYLSVTRLFRNVPAWKNPLLAVRDRLKRGAYLRPVTDYPRGALMRALPCLLGIEDKSVGDAARFLPKPGAGENWQDVYARWWQHYS
ncbi:MAG: hypothetical protein JWO82_1006 [Akkermansiaceae bacterium]|nr:hypothetical protein [Akkermansiaceae bacterium]